MKPKIYEYKNCGTCRKALKFLEANQVKFESLPIREIPPTADELRKMLACYGGQIRRLFNTSGEDYRKLKLKEKLAGLSVEEAIDLLSKNGNLVKRPFALFEGGGLAGFEEEEWREHLVAWKRGK